MNPIKSIQNLSRFEKILWITSLLVIAISYFSVDNNNYMTVITSLVGATALIFLSKGDALGQFLSIIFALLYAIVSFQCRYYGEMITYLGMTLPSALVAMINWLRHPYTEREVEISHVSKKKWLFLCISSVFVTIFFGFVLKYFGTANLLFSTISVSTSYFACMLTIFRSPYYAIAYSFNDVVLIILWVLASIENVCYLPMILCFLVFLANDIYGFVNWRIMAKRQSKGKNL